MPQSQDTPNTPTPCPTIPPKTKDPFFIATIVLGVVILFMIGIIIYLAYTKKKPQIETT